MRPRVNGAWLCRHLNERDAPYVNNRSCNNGQTKGGKCVLIPYGPIFFIGNGGVRPVGVDCWLGNLCGHAAVGRDCQEFATHSGNRYGGSITTKSGRIAVAVVSHRHSTPRNTARPSHHNRRNQLILQHWTFSNYPRYGSGGQVIRTTTCRECPA